MDAGLEVGVPHGNALTRFVDAVHGDDAGERDSARRDLLGSMGQEALVDAAAVLANFNQMVRIADGCGIPLDEPLDLASTDLREEIGVTAFASAANTPAAGLAKRTLGRTMGVLLSPFESQLMRLMAKFR